METRAILLVVELHVPSLPSLARALMLSRYLHARLDIHIYPPLSIRPGSPAQARQWQEEVTDYVAALRQSIVAPDVEIAIDLAHQGSLNDAIVEKAQQDRYALIIKVPSHRRRNRSDPGDWQLIQRCSVPLLLTVGRQWQPKARFLAAIDAVNPLVAGQGEAILEAANALKLACAAELDLAQIGPASSHDAAQNGAATQFQLERLVRQYDLAASRLHHLSGLAGEPLRLLLAEGAFDLLIVGVSNEIRPPWSPATGLTLTQSRSAADCDLLMIPSSGKVQPFFSGRRLLRWNAIPFWQWLGTD
jgi:hypothetical protein